MLKKGEVPRWHSDKEPTCQCRRCQRCGFDPWRRKWQPTPVFLLGKSHGQRSLAGYSPWDPKESDMTAAEHTHAEKCRKSHLVCYWFYREDLCVSQDLVLFFFLEFPLLPPKPKISLSVCVCKCLSSLQYKSVSTFL